MGNTKNKDCMAYKNKLAYTLKYNKGAYNQTNCKL